MSSCDLKEKQAIEILKQEPDFSLSYYKREKAIDIVLNLIEKQQKQIEKLKKRNDLLESHISKWYQNINTYIQSKKN